MTLDKVILENFLTYEFLEFDIPKRPLQVQGRNLTEEDQESNGSGKSGILSAIEFCITASNSRDVRDNELVSFGQKEGRVQLFASCNVRKEQIHIDWIIKVKGSNKLTLTKKKGKENWEEVSFSNVNDGKRYIMAWFAISREDLFNYYIINNSRFKSFFKSSQKEKVDLINRFSDASIVDGLEDVDNVALDSQFSSLENEVSRIDGKIEVTEERIVTEKNRDFSFELDLQKSDIVESIDKLNGAIESNEVHLVDLEDDKKEIDREVVENLEAIEAIKTKREKFSESLDKKKLELSPIESEIQEAEKLVTDFKTTNWEQHKDMFNGEIQDLNGDLEEQFNERTKREGQEGKILKFLKDIDTKLSGMITCPSCSHEFILDGDIDTLKGRKKSGETLKANIAVKLKEVATSIKDARASIAEREREASKINKKEEKENSAKNKLQVKVNELKEKLSDYKEALTPIESDISSCDLRITELKEEISESELEKKDIDIEYSETSSQISQNQSEIKSIKRELQQLEEEDNKELLKDLRAEIKDFEKEKAIKKEELEKIGDKIYLRNQWKNNFKQFRMYLANQSLEVIEFHCNRYLAGMGSDLKVKMEGYKILANGAVKDDISAKIVRNIERTFSSFSGGERGRLLFASILANRHMINQAHPYGGLDFLSVDEVFEGIDSIGIDSLIHSAKQLNIAVMLITHVVSENVDEDVLVIEKVNGLSRIKS